MIALLGNRLLLRAHLRERVCSFVGVARRPRKKMLVLGASLADKEEYDVQARRLGRALRATKARYE